eukprot:SAG25_NODE_870_length_5001_cov_3.347205_2_plen_272_part_00
MAACAHLFSANVLTTNYVPTISSQSEVTFLKAQVKKYSEAARDRNSKARRVVELESELQNVSQPFLNMSRSVTGLNNDIGSMITSLKEELESEVKGLHQHMETASQKVKETEQLNVRVREYEELLVRQQAIMEQEQEAKRRLEQEAEMAAQVAAQAEADAAAAAAAQAEAEAEVAAAEAAEAAAVAAAAAAASDTGGIHGDNTRTSADAASDDGGGGGGDSSDPVPSVPVASADSGGLHASEGLTKTVAEATGLANGVEPSPPQQVVAGEG